jgi:large subunit ribosomal protein L24
VQTALLSAGIAIILALVTALVGPFFVDWGSYRTEFETEVARLTGLEVRVAGPIDVRLLPTPTLTLQQIELGRPGDPAKTRAQALRIEFALGDLLRGVLRAPDLKLQGPELTLSLDPSGRVVWSAPTIGLDPDAVSIEHLEIEDGRATLADAASGAHLSLEQLEFTGQVRSLLGPVKGEGSFAVDGQHYPFQLAVSRPADDGGVKVRLDVAPIDHPRTLDVDGSIWVDKGLPRFEGTLQLTRPVGRSPDGIIESWRLSSHVRADGAAALLEQVELQYGPDERAIRLKGDAKLSFGAKPELVATLSAAQIDLDRILALPAPDGRRPLVAIRTLAESLVRSQRLPVALRLGISVETVTLAGAMLQRVGGDLRSDSGGWNIENLALRAPGLTQVAFSGRLGASPEGVAFNGATKIESADPQALIGWLADRPNGQPAPSGALRLTSDVALGGGKIALDRVQAELDRMKIEGRLDYTWPDGDRPAKLNAVLRAPELDLDRAQSLVLASLGPPLDWPREGTLAIDIGRTTVGGVEAKDIAVQMRRDTGGLDIERVAIGNIGGAKLTVSGRVDTHEAAPRGTLALDLDARSLDGMAALVAKFSGPVADRIRRIASRAVPLKLHTSLALDRDAAAASGGSTVAKFKLQGTAGVLRLDLQGDAGGSPLASADLAQLGSTKIHLTGAIDASEGGALVDMLGLDRLIMVNQRSGRLALELNGPLDGDLAVKGTLAAGGLDVSANGTLHPSGSRGATAQIALRAAAAEVIPLRSATVQLPWSTLTARLMLADGTLTLAELNGSLAGVGIKGELGIGMTEPMRLNGDISVAALDLPAALGVAIGYPRQNGNGNGAWPADPFETGLLSSVIGRIKVTAAQVALTSKLSAHDLHAVLDFNPSELAVADIDGALAGGRIGGDFGFERGDEGVRAHSRFRLAGVDAAELLGGGARAPLSGKLTADLDLAGSGRSPIALVGSLEGHGTFSLRDGGVARFDPAAFDIVTRAVDQGLPIDATRIGNRMEVALAISALPVPLAEGSIAASMGQLRLVDPVVHAKGAELTPTGSIDLTQSAINARLVLSGSQIADPAGDASVGNHPDISVVLKGPIDAPKRTLDVAALANWLALRAVDQKAKRVDVLEQAAREHPDDEGVTTGSPADRDPVTSVPEAPPRAARPSSVTSPVPGSVVPSAPPRQRTILDPSAAPIIAPAAKAADEPHVRRPNPTVEQAPLSPPLDLRPPPPPHGPRG